MNDKSIDIGAASAEGVERLDVTIGTPVTMEHQFTSLSNNLVTGKTLDDRAGCAGMIERIFIGKKKRTLELYVPVS